jgi:hypothetical protein
MWYIFFLSLFYFGIYGKLGVCHRDMWDKSQKLILLFPLIQGKDHEANFGITRMHKVKWWSYIGSIINLFLFCPWLPIPLILIYRHVLFSGMPVTQLKLIHILCTRHKWLTLANIVPHWIISNLMHLWLGL